MIAVRQVGAAKPAAPVARARTRASVSHARAPERRDFAAVIHDHGRLGALMRHGRGCARQHLDVHDPRQLHCTERAAIHLRMRHEPGNGLLHTKQPGAVHMRERGGYAARESARRVGCSRPRLTLRR